MPVLIRPKKYPRSEFTHHESSVLEKDLGWLMRNRAFIAILVATSFVWSVFFVFNGQGSVPEGQASSVPVTTQTATHAVNSVLVVVPSESVRELGWFGSISAAALAHAPVLAALGIASDFLSLMLLAFSIIFVSVISNIFSCLKRGDMPLHRKVALVAPILRSSAVSSFQEYTKRHENGTYACSYAQHCRLHAIARHVFGGTAVLAVAKIVLVIALGSIFTLPASSNAQDIVPDAPTVSTVCISTPEVCDGIDTDCDGIIDNGVQISFFKDADGDGYGSGMPTAACSAPAGYSASGADCDDGNSAVHPDARAIIGNGIDEDCSGADTQANR